MPDHNTPTHDQDKPIEDPVSKAQVDALAKNAADFGLTHFGMMDKRNGIIHVVGPERGLTLPGMTIVCGDSHTSTHGAMGHAWCHGSRCFRYRNQRGGNGDGFAMYFAGTSENHADYDRRKIGQRCDG